MIIHVFQYEACEKRNDVLVVDLYKENAGLMQQLYAVEGQKKDAVARCYRLESQCNNLQQMWLSHTWSWIWVVIETAINCSDLSNQFQ